MPDSYQIRPFDKATDLPALAQLIFEVHGERVTPESLARTYGSQDPKCAFSSWVAEVDGQIVGNGLYEQSPSRYHPRKFHLGIGVHPAHRGRGIGAALYRHLREMLQPHDPIALSATARENLPEAIAFLERRGFRERIRNWESFFDLTAFEPEALEAAVTVAEANGYEFRSYVALAADPQRDRQLYDLMMVARRDVPAPEPLSDISFEDFMKRFDRPTFLPEAWYIAIKDGRYVGLSNLWTTNEAELLETGLTAVLREHRGAGVAKALKIKALGAVKAMGRYRRVKTYNATTNAPMLAINDWLGFVRRPAWISYSLQLKSEE